MVQVLLPSSGRRALALVIGGLLLGISAVCILRSFAASQARAQGDRAGLERAARLESDNALTEYRLGQWEQYSFEDGDLHRALRHYRRATELNPYDGLYWIDRADALLLAGDLPTAETAVENALRVDPHTPNTLWRVGNFWLRAGQPARAFPYFRQVLLVEPSLIWPVIQISHRALGDPEILLRELLPAQPGILLTYLRYLVREREDAAAARVWEALVTLQQPFDPHQVLFYVDYLIGAQQLPQAVKAWNDLKTLHLLPAELDTAGAAEGELLHNPELRAPIWNGGFDWQVELHPHVSVMLGPGRQGENPPAVAIRFSGEDNLHYRNFFQYVVVAPNTRYRFQAWLTTDGITTESGPRLEVGDAYAPQVPPALSPDLLGTNNWTLQQVEYVTGPQTRLLRVGIARLPSHRLESRIRGTVRGGEFSLRAVAAPGRRGAP